MRRSRLIFILKESLAAESFVNYEDTLTESLWDTVKDQSLHILLREPALVELARRKDPGVIVFCDSLLRSEDQESWFTSLKALETLNTYDAAQRLLVLAGSSNTTDRKIVLNVLAKILSSSHRESFRRLLRSIVTPGELDVTDWSPIALRVLEFVCNEKGIEVVNTAGLPLSDLGTPLTAAFKREAVELE